MDTTASFFGGVVGILLLGTFVRIITMLSIVKFALGLSSKGLGIAFALLAFVLSILTLEVQGPVKVDVKALFSGDTAIELQGNDAALREYLVTNSEPAFIERLSTLKKSNDKINPETTVALSAFLLTQLKWAFSAGVMILIPFLVIDVLVSVSLVAAGITSMSAAAIAVPLKLLVFVAVDGWGLLIHKWLGV